MLSEEEIAEILDSTLSELLTEHADPTVMTIFREPYDGESEARAVEFHRWVNASYRVSTAEEVKDAAFMALSELVETPRRVAAEILLENRCLLSRAPLWKDGATIHSSCNTRTRDIRFGVSGGNVVKATRSPLKDIRKAIERLRELDFSGTMNETEPLQIICSHEVIAKLTKSLRREEREIRLIPLKTLGAQDPIFVGRVAPIAVVKVSKPTLPEPDSSKRVLVGARFSVWLDDPSTSVRIG